MSIIESKSQLIEYFIQGIKKENQLIIGVEHEKFLFSGKEKKRANYKQIKKIFKNLETFGWKPVYEKEKVVGLKRGATNFNYQTSVSGFISLVLPLKNIHLVCSESSTHFKEIKLDVQKILRYQHELYWV